MDTTTLLTYFAKASYFLAAVMFILGIKRMASPVTARKGIVQAGLGMVIATLATFAITGTHNLGLIVLAIVLGVAPTWIWGKRVAITDMPQMVALAHADTTLGKTIGFLGVMLGAGNAAGGYVVTERMLEMFKSSKGK